MISLQSYESLAQQLLSAKHVANHRPRSVEMKENQERVEEALPWHRWNDELWVSWTAQRWMCRCGWFSLVCALVETGVRVGGDWCARWWRLVCANGCEGAEGRLLRADARVLIMRGMVLRIALY
eukprot:613294-Rhodomonas_salina.1